MRTPEDPCRDPASEARDDHASEPRATPQTDAQGHGDGRHLYVPTEFARRLERQRDEWKSIAKEALMSFRCTQRPEIYPEGHWSRRAQGLLGGHAIAAVKGGRDE
jgi:hypothetical protein